VISEGRIAPEARALAFCFFLAFSVLGVGEYLVLSFRGESSECEGIVEKRVTMEILTRCQLWAFPGGNIS
jgi:hypothetical protein